MTAGANLRNLDVVNHGYGAIGRCSKATEVRLVIDLDGELNEDAACGAAALLLLSRTSQPKRAELMPQLAGLYPQSSYNVIDLIGKINVLQVQIDRQALCIIDLRRENSAKESELEGLRSISKMQEQAEEFNKVFRVQDAEASEKDKEIDNLRSAICSREHVIAAHERVIVDQRARIGALERNIDECDRVFIAKEADDADNEAQIKLLEHALAQSEDQCRTLLAKRAELLSIIQTCENEARIDNDQYECEIAGLKDELAKHRLSGRWDLVEKMRQEVSSAKDELSRAVAAKDRLLALSLEQARKLDMIHRISTGGRDVDKAESKPKENQEFYYDTAFTGI